jgi:hypothetical protein
MSIPKWPWSPPPRVDLTALALPYNSLRRFRTAAAVGVESGSSAVRGSCGRRGSMLCCDAIVGLLLTARVGDTSGGLCFEFLDFSPNSRIPVPILSCFCFAVSPPTGVVLGCSLLLTALVGVPVRGLCDGCVAYLFLV